MKKLAFFTLCLASVCVSTTAAADKIYSPRVEFGETEVELRTEVVDNNQARSNENLTQTKLEIGQGITPHWMTEFVAEFERDNGNTRASAAEWENIFQLTETGEHFVDVGLLVEMEKALLNEDPDELVAGLLLEKDLGSFTTTANINFEKQFGANHEDDIEKILNARLLWRYQPTFQPAIETFLEEDKKQIGPMIYGVMNAGKSRKLKYDAGVLFGTNNDSPDRVWRVNFEYEF